MKFKYMIRGMGLGVIITAVIMGAYSRNAVAGARVAVLREYGLGEQSRLVEESEVPGGNASEEVSDAPPTEQVILRDEEKEAEIGSVLDAARDSEPVDAVQGDSGPSDAAPGEEASDPDAAAPDAAVDEAPPEEGAQSPAVDTIDIVIASGDNSKVVARKLQNAGVIGSADEYDAYLTQHGYDKRLTTGTKTISVTDTWQDIAEKLTR